MKKYFPIRINLLLEIALFLGVVGCGRIESSINQEGPTVAPALAFTSTEGEREPTSSNMVKASSTLQPTFAETQTPFSTSPLTSTPTWTPVPTLSTEEAHVLVQDLLVNNGGCQLPCWWGIVPGETDWNTAKHFLDTFVIDIEQRWKNRVTRNGVKVPQAGYDIGYEIEDGVQSGIFMIVENGIVSEAVIGPGGTRRHFRLHQLLTDYGAPDEVYFQTERYTNTGGPPPFVFIVYYGRKHFWADFHLDGEIVGGVIKACPQSVNPFLWIGSPEREWDMDDLFSYVFGPPAPDAPPPTTLTLKEATGMDLETFTTTFKNPDENICIETPAELWH
jgi:hypothetical protein